MSEFNLFNFVENFSKELGTLASRIEGQLFDQPHATLMQTRLYSEQLVKLVSEAEEIEKVYPLKHSERIHKLYRNNAIEEEIYMKLEWLRKKGNSAAHNVKEIEIEDVIKAHKFIFDISVWYMQVYVSYDFEAPIYKLPIKGKQETLEIEGKIDGLIKPYLDETLKKIDDMWAEINQELQAIKIEKEQLAQLVPAVEPDEEQEQPVTNTFSLLEYLEENELEYIDKRPKNGALWIIGDWSMGEMLTTLKSHKLYFRYSKKGGRTTGFQPAWYLLNKSLPEKEDSVSKEVIAPEPEDAMPNKEEKSEKVIVERVEPSISSITIKPATADVWKSKGQLLIPASLDKVKLEQRPLEGIQILIDKLSLKEFGELTDEALRKVFQQSQTDFYKMMMDLYWLGFRFTGNLEKLQPGPVDIAEQQIIVSQENPALMSAMLPRHLSVKFEGKLVTLVQDLDGMLVSSIEFLFKDDADFVMNLLAAIRSEPEHENTSFNVGIEKEVPKVEEPEKRVEEDTNKAQITYKGQTLTVTGDHASMPLTELGIEGCNNLLIRIKKLGVYSLSDIKGPIDDIHLELPSIGPGTVEKFWNQLIHLYKKTDLSETLETQYEPNTINLNGTAIYVDEAKDVALEPNDFPGLENTVRIIKEVGMLTFGQLPSDFSKIGKINKIGITKVNRMFERLPIVLERIKLEEEINKLSDEERILFELNSFHDWFERVSKSEKEAKTEKIQPRYLRLMNDRYEAFLRGEHLTLEMLGEQEGVTRERIRQILGVGDDRVCQHFTIFIDLITKRLEANGHIIEDDFFEAHDVSRYILWSALERKRIYFTKIRDIAVLTLKDSSSLQDYIVNIELEVEKLFALHVVTQDDLTSYSKERSLEDQVDQSIIFAIATDRINWLTEGQGVLKSFKKVDAVEMVMLQFPNGVEVYKREGELIERANDFMPGGFEGERSFSSIISRDGIADRIVLWGRGIYVHTRFITDDKEWILSIQDVVEQWLEEEDFIHVRKLYTKFEAEAKSRNIPNEYALYSLIRRYPIETLYLPKFPMIIPEGVDRQANYEWIMQYIEEQGRPIKMEELVEVFVNTRGWRRFTLESNLANAEEIIQYEHGSYTLLSNYDHIKEEDLRFVASSIEQQLKDKPIIFIHAAFEENEPILRSLGIETKHVLYGILKGFGYVNARLTRYPYIVSFDFNFDQFSMTQFIEEFIRNEKTIVPREEVNQWIEDLFGPNDRILDLALIHSKNILYFSKGQFGEYIHRDTIQMYGETEQAIHEIIRNRYDERKEIKQRAYVFLDEVYNPSILPQLDKSFPWSVELLGDILKKSDQWTLIGSYEEILLPAGASITDDIDFIAYILTHRFDGAVKLSQLRTFLSSIRYSSQGNLLTDVNEAIENGTAPYSIIGDELIHKDLNGGHGVE